METKTHKFEILDGIRGIAALSVMLYHFTQFTALPLLPHADIAVDLFFVLSGFVLAHSYGARLENGMSVGGYLVKRLIRLYPMFLIGLAFGTGVSLLAIDQLPAGLVEDDVLACGGLNALFLPCIPDLFRIKPETSIFPANNVLWSLMFEMIASIAFIFLHRAGSKMLAGICAASAIALIAFGAVPSLMQGHHDFFNFAMGWGTSNIQGGLPRVIYGFGLGIAIYRLYPKLRDNRLVQALCNTRWFIVLLTIGLIAMFSIPLSIKGFYFLAGALIVSPLCVAIGAVARPQSDTVLAACKFLGWISYPVYCLHFPVMLAFHHGAENAPDNTQAWMILAETAVSLALAIVVVRLYDQPLRAWLTRKAFGSFNAVS